MITFLQILIYGLAVGAIYGMVALGFVLLFKGTGVFNVAQGEFLMLGAFIAYTLSVQVGLPFYLAAILTLVFAIVLAFAIERVFLRPLIGQPILPIIMMTIGLSLLIKSIVMLVWGYKFRPLPDFIPMGSLSLGELSLSYDYIACFVVAGALLVIFLLYFKFTRAGLSMRGTADDQQVVSALGVKVERVFALSWSIALLTAAVGGILLGYLTGVNYALGHIGLYVIPAVILGGLESIPGAIIGGLVIGVVENLSAAYIGLPGFRAIGPYIILMLVLIMRPHGLFGLKRIERI